MAENQLINSRESEVSILGSVMIDSTIFPRIVSLLVPEDFFYGDTRKVYTVMMKLSNDGVEINVKSVWNELYKLGYSELTEETLREFLDYQAGGAAAVAFATQVSEFSGYRILQQEVDNISTLIRNKANGLSDFSGMLNGLANRISAKGVRQNIITGAQMIDEYFEMLTKKKSDFAFTGISSIDDRIFDLEAKEVSFLAGRPGQGKTAMMLQSVKTNLKRGKRIGFLSMEMSRPKLVNRMVSAIAGVDSTVIRKLPPEEFVQNEALAKATTWLGAMPLFIDDTGPWTNSAVSQKVRRMVYDQGIDIVYIDYIGLIDADNAGGGNRNNELSIISRTAKNLATELSIPFFIASQINREAAKRTGGRPVLSDLRDSGCLTGDSLVAMTNGRRVPIRDVKPGDKVWSLDEKTMKIKEESVSRAFSTGVKTVLKLKLQTGKELRLTGNHPLFIINGWKRTDALVVGEHIAIPRLLPSTEQENTMSQGESEGDLYWDKVVSIEPDGVEEVFDLTVPGCHNFIANDILVHNSLEQDGSIVAFLYADTTALAMANIADEDVDEYAKGEDKLDVKFEIAKQRNGPTFSTNLVFHKSHGAFYDKTAYLATY